MNKKSVIKILIVFLIALLLLIFNFIPSSFDNSITTLFSKVHGEKQPDSSIVIIHINSEDIEQLGPWPLKRSYYALLINNLAKYRVKKIGLEVFLSSKFASQAIYDNVLQKEILKSNKVVLSSLAGSLNEVNNNFTTDSLSFPSPKLIDETITTGHINFIRNNGIEIPLSISTKIENEKSFSLSLSDSQNNYHEKIKVNFISSWEKFKRYSLIQFFQLAQSRNEELLKLENKIVLIGISDPQLSLALETNFDEKLPGVALHAFALDNLLNSRYVNNDYYFLSIVFLLFIVLIIILLQKAYSNLSVYYVAIVSIFLLTAFFLHSYFNIVLAYSYILIPILAIIFIDYYYYLIEKKSELELYFDESVLLKKLLMEKEKDLNQLQTKLSYTNDQKAEDLLNKIELLKVEIEKLKENEKDQKPTDLRDFTDEENFYGLIFKSAVMRNIVSLISKSAPTDAAILITGESGTGKELVARAIHSLSKRKEKIFIAVNCAALTESLLESELFGHVKGAFTGAISDKTGKFEAANKGTIFLDEIGETSENFQVKLLRVLQSGEYDKVGSINTAITDVRVISATNKDIKQLIKEKKFREDLFYRINVINIDLPPLRERKEDIEAIVRYFCETGENKKYKLSIAVLDVLNNYNWPGNVRELESVIRRATVFCDADNRTLIQLNDLPDEIVKDIKINIEDIIIQSLRNKQFSHSSIVETAKELGNVNRTLVAENFRGLSFKLLVENNFDERKTIMAISLNENEDILLRVKSKIEMWIANINKDIEPYKKLSFEEIKLKLNSKYKNLPQKYHKYLDEVIKNNIDKLLN